MPFHALGDIFRFFKKKYAAPPLPFFTVSLIESVLEISLYLKRIPVTEPVWKDLAEMRSAGQTSTDLLAEMIEDRKKRR